MYLDGGDGIHLLAIWKGADSMERMESRLQYAVVKHGAVAFEGNESFKDLADAGSQGWGLRNVYALGQLSSGDKFAALFHFERPAPVPASRYEEPGAEMVSVQI